MFLVIGGLAFLSHYYTLDGIKSKTVGDGQHGTARWATKQEIRQTYAMRNPPSLSYCPRRIRPSISWSA